MLQKKRFLRRRRYFLTGIACGAAVMFLILHFIYPAVSAVSSAETASSGEKTDAGATDPDSGGSGNAGASSPGNSGGSACPEEQLRSDSGWELTLINRDHPLSHDYVPASLTEIPGGCSVDSRIADALNRMLSDARSAGMNVSVISGYRSHETQTELFADGMTERIAGGLTPEQAYTDTVQSVTLPGTSEHAAGLAVDITASSYPVLEESQARRPEQQWLMEHCYEYGFILRYPDGSEDITGITYEPWHYRYVGEAAAAEIHARGITLEEYLQDQ